MGFWHTGYMEFHEETGLEDFTFQPRKPVYPCQHCGQNFDSIDELRTHRFEFHPYTRPLLFVKGIELGATPFRVTRLSKPADFVVDRCSKASVNGNSVKLAEIPKLLSDIKYDKITLELSNDGLSTVFELVFRIADEQHLKGVETSFLRFANQKELTVRSLEGFIQECREFNTAEDYYGGICDYLYGILAKERARDSSLPYDKFPERFNRAADSLSDYDRPLAKMVRSLVALYFNHFEDMANFAPTRRLFFAATRFSGVLNGKMSWDDVGRSNNESTGAPEDMLTDHETHRILRWTQMPLAKLANEIEDLSSLVKGDISEFDRLKLNIMLAEASVKCGNFVLARKTARALISDSKTAGWAERLMARL